MPLFFFFFFFFGFFFVYVFLITKFLSLPFLLATTLIYRRCSRKLPIFYLLESEELGQSPEVWRVVVIIRVLKSRRQPCLTLLAPARLLVPIAKYPNLYLIYGSNSRLDYIVMAP